MRAKLFFGVILLCGVLSASAFGETPLQVTPLQIYGAWHCSDDGCVWGHVRDMKDFDAKNHWLVDRGDGQPSVNLVILSFLHPMKLLQRTTDSETLEGAPLGMNQAVIDYFTSHKIRVMLSIGGEAYSKYWDDALAVSGTQMGMNAAAIAKKLGVGIEIDYENDTKPNLKALQDFVTAYRAQLPYDPTGKNEAARLTIDLGASNSFLTDLSRYAAANWLSTTKPVLDYANAMVPDGKHTASEMKKYWQEHIDGNAQASPPIPPIAPAKLTGSLFMVRWRGGIPAECKDLERSLQKGTGDYARTVEPHAGKSKGMLGYMFWAAECQNLRGACTTPPNTCERGVGAGAKLYQVPVPMPPLRQE